MSASAQGHPTRVLALLAATQFAIILDAAIVGVALPSIAAQLDFDGAGRSWIVNAYVLPFGGLLVLAGRTGDRVGRRRVFVAGTALFMAASALGSLAASAHVLVLARAGQGLAAAFVSAAALSLLLATFAPGRGRERALGAWAAVSAAGGATGFLLGGVLVAAFGWRSVFAVNVPIALAIVVIAHRLLAPDAARPRRSAFDLAGAVTLTAGIAGGAFVLVDGGRIGYDSVGVRVLTLMSAALLVAFWAIERRAADPLVPPAVLRSAPVVLANLVAGLITMAVTPMFFFLTLYVQDVLRLGPLAAGLAILPLSVVIATAASRTPRAVARWGTERTLAGGLALLTVGLGLYSRLPLAAAIVPEVLLPSLVAGVGAGTVWVAATSAATAGADGTDAGLYAGLVSTAQQLGSVIGLAVLSVLAAATTGSTDTPSAMAEGLRAGFLGGAVFTAIATLITVTRFVRGPLPRAARPSVSTDRTAGDAGT